MKNILFLIFATALLTNTAKADGIITLWGTFKYVSTPGVVNEMTQVFEVAIPSGGTFSYIVSSEGMPLSGNAIQSLVPGKPYCLRGLVRVHPENAKITFSPTQVLPLYGPNCTPLSGAY